MVPSSASTLSSSKPLRGSSAIFVEAHCRFIAAHDDVQPDYSLAYWAREHLYLSGLYWGLMSTRLLGRRGAVALDEAKATAYALKCQNSDTGGFAGNAGGAHAPHVLHTLSGIQILALCGQLDVLKSTDSISSHVRFLRALQRPDGSFIGMSGASETDTRFAYCALACLHLLGRQLDNDSAARTAAYIHACQNPDGGYGLCPGAESHAGQTFCCVAALCFLGETARRRQLLHWWLIERQQECGGFNGRPEKAADTCYSWWVYSTLALLNHKGKECIDIAAARDFLIARQSLRGGLAAHPGDSPDLFHTHFGLAALGVLGHEGICCNVDPLTCLPGDSLPLHMTKENKTKQRTRRTARRTLV